MNSKQAIKNVVDVPNKYNKSGGEVSGAIFPKNHNTTDLGKLDKSFNNVYCNRLISSDPGDSSYNSELKYCTTQAHQEGAWILNNYEGSLTVGQSGTDIRGTGTKGLTYNSFPVYHTGNKPTPADIGAAPAHSHDFIGPAGNWSTNGAQDLKVHGKRALVGMADGNLHLSYGGDFTNVLVNNNTIWHNGNLVPSTLSVNYANSAGFANSSANAEFANDAANANYAYDAGKINNKKITISQTAPAGPSTGDLWISW